MNGSKSNLVLFLLNKTKQKPKVVGVSKAKDVSYLFDLSFKA